MKITCRFKARLTDNDGNETAVEEYMSRDCEYLWKEDIKIFTKEVIEKLSKIME